MFHVHAWGIPYIATLLGVKQVYPGRYEPKMILQLLSGEKVTFSHCVPTILQMILANSATQQMDFSGWQVVVGGAALSKGLARMAEDRGIRVVVGYGMSETGPLVAISHHRSDIHEEDEDAKLDITISTGFPPPLVQARIFDLEGNELPLGKENVGELVLRAPWLTMGYFKSPEQSAELWSYGWMRTGDIAYIDEDGYIRITDRLKDVIKIAGEWISSLELENALSQHEAVADVAVVGKPHEKWGEIPCAFVVLKVGTEASCDKKTLARHLHTFVDSGIIHKRSILTEIEFMDQLPKTGVGKNNKRALRDELLPD
jgi:fatty-acyl-CoA synthase